VIETTAADLLFNLEFSFSNCDPGGKAGCLSLVFGWEIQ
jgi:hypothetical protein